MLKQLFICFILITPFIIIATPVKENPVAPKKRKDKVVTKKKKQESPKKSQKKEEKKQNDDKKKKPKSQHSKNNIPTPIAPKTITLTNGITKESVGYQKMGWRYPDKFTLTVDEKPLLVIDGKKVTDNKTVTIPAEKPFTVTYHYEWYAPWPWGTKKGAKTVSFKAPATSKEPLNIMFESHWLEEERITIPGAKKVSKEMLVE